MARINEEEWEKQPAQSQWSTGRSCPKCAGPLMIWEANEELDIQYVKCKQCKGVYATDDIDAHASPGADDLYRNIPPERVMYYTRQTRKRKK